MQGDKIYESNTYLTPHRLLMGVNIYEYDIRQANINVLYSYDSISYEEYRRLSESSKMYREIAIGKMEAYRDDVYSTIQKGIIEAKRQLITTNNVSSDNIVRIANDAIYIISSYPLKYTKFQLNPQKAHEVEFVCKNCFQDYLHLRDVCVFLYKMENEDIDVDVKGLGKYINLHEPFLEFLVDTIMYKKMTYDSGVWNHFIDFYKDYINRRLDISYYREFNAGSSFRLRRVEGKERVVPFNIMSPEGLSVNDIDIGYNLSLLRELYSIIL